MSRETDSSTSGPQGRGGAAYPSGTPPYGTPHSPAHDAPEAAVAEPDEPKTETTLTTRIRINIPGSRPIPPVVMRTPVSDADKASAAESERAQAAEAQEAAAAAAPAAEEKPASDWFAPRKAGSGATPPSGTPRANLPYFSDGPQGAPADGPATGADAFGNGTGTNGGDFASANGSNGFAPGPDANGFRPGTASANGSARSALAGNGGPAGPTTGPVTGTAALPTRPVGSRKGQQRLGGAPGGPHGTPSHGTPVLGAQGPGGTPSHGTPVPGGQGVRPGPVAPPVPQMSDDTAILTPQAPAPVPGAGSGGGNPAPPAGHVSGDTLTSGIPVVPAEGRSPFAPGGAGTGPDLTPRLPDGPRAAQEPPAPARTSAPAPAKKKGRSKLVLLGVAAFALAGVAYGAGLLLNHSEVPKGTTVLGVDIGGGSKEQAVAKLDATLGKRAAQPLRLTVDGKKETLAADKAGLTFDSQATVRNAAGSDYNPVSVISSLFGGKRVAEPVIPVDEEKLGVALTDLAGASGSAVEGTIKFVPGKAVAVPGKAGKALDVDRSVISVKDAYRAQVGTGRPNEVQLPVTSRQPTIAQAEIDRAMNEFAKPAMSGLITVKAGGKQINFGPQKSLPKILSMKPIEGKLVEVYDKKAIEQLMGSTFNGVMITKGDGQKHQLTSDDVAKAMQGALRGKTPAERIVTIELNPS
ncbi:hypothetical protein [Streptomyces sp. BPTC-684]|uniref:hypothetical protein n=1 Tax=Streptomyces sp. BPTC-684 TaxID=3043734 RepID=UPI0024B1971B|nr:hypothetical protein [Streptomyces sp. BPTC-684]WHM36788.1 hypothetical protein QIY60_07730 [Streptomyces sp. BPTC-684]